LKKINMPIVFQLARQKQIKTNKATSPNKQVSYPPSEKQQRKRKKKRETHTNGDRENSPTTQESLTTIV
jgi:hypothetical protein